MDFAVAPSILPKGAARRLVVGRRILKGRFEHVLIFQIHQLHRGRLVCQALGDLFVGGFLRKAAFRYQSQRYGGGDQGVGFTRCPLPLDGLRRAVDAPGGIFEKLGIIDAGIDRFQKGYLRLVLPADRHILLAESVFPEGDQILLL